LLEDLDGRLDVGVLLVRPPCPEERLPRRGHGLVEPLALDREAGLLQHAHPRVEALVATGPAAVEDEGVPEVEGDRLDGRTAAHDEWWWCVRVTPSTTAWSATADATSSTTCLLNTLGTM